MFEYSDFSFCNSPLIFTSMHFGFELYILDLSLHYLDLTFAKIDVGFYP